jgi:RNA polymerase sigma factor (sigma-70 family)
LTLTEIPLHRQSDAALVASARRSVEPPHAAFGELVRRYQRVVYALALSLVRPDDADDVAQEAFLRAFQNLDLLADSTRFGVWLRRITFGVAIDHLRAVRARQSVAFTSAELTQADDDAMPDPPDSGLSPLQRLERDEVASRVLAALDRLPARYRIPLTLYHIDGLTHGKVARTLGVPEATVRSLVARARRKLARILASSPEARDMTRDSSSLPESADVLDDSVTVPRFLHVLNGDSVRVTLERSDVPGTFAVYADVLHEGPVPQVTGTAAWREARSRFLSSADVPSPDVLRRYEEWDARMEAFREYDEVVLWFEHDLFDQLLLLKHLDWFSRRPLGRTRLSLICIGEFPGFEPFHGLGQLDPDQLTSLLGTRQPVAAGQLTLGSRAWWAFTAANPSELDELAQHDVDGLPFVAGALRRFVEEYPSRDTGLPRTERESLALLVDGPRSPEALFLAVQRREERVFMGDTTFWDRVLVLAAGPTPLVLVDAEPDGRALPAGIVTITDAGRDVLAGRADWIHLDGFDRWLGGVHLTAPLGGDVAWRRDPATGRLYQP